jgi:hypothetical protein
MNFDHPLCRSTPKPIADKEEVHSSENKEETTGDIDDTAHTVKTKVATKK